MKRASIFLLLFGVLLAGCSTSDEDRIQSMVGDLADALNDHDPAAASQLYAGGAVVPVTSAGDSSAIYRMLHIPGGSDFEVTNVQSTVAGDQARTSFNLAGKVHHGDSLAGTMTLRLRLELEKQGEEWKFLPESEGQEMGR